MTCTASVDTLPLMRPIANMCANLQYLVKLKFTSIAPKTTIAVIDLLQGLRMLTSLEFAQLIIKEEPTDELL